jgi:hypothetical protein
MSESLPTLLFCTSYMDSRDTWLRRYTRWMDYYADAPLARRASFLIDDASPFVPDDPRLSVVEELPATLSASTFHLHRFPVHRGRGNFKEHWGWWRSFLFSLTIARRYGCRKIIHIESDAFLLSPSIVDYVNRLSAGWTTFWCPRYKMPEAAIQVIVEDQFPAMQRLAKTDIRKLTRKTAELILPFTCISKSFVGDRYGEHRLTVPDDADFACQINSVAIPVAFRGSTSNTPA